MGYTELRQQWAKVAFWGWITTSDGVTRWGPYGAAGVLFMHRGNPTTYYLTHRGSGTDRGNTWSIPGGALDKGETAEEAAKREAREEVGYNGPWNVVKTYVDRPVPEWSYTTFVVEVDKPFDGKAEGGFNWETQGAGWFSAEAMRSLNLHPAFAEAREHLVVGKLAAHGNLFWRLHPSSRPFDPQSASSTPFVNVPGEVGTQRGFSCFESPWTLWLYLNAQFGSSTSSDQVLAFTGEQVGTGMDGEDLVVPDMKVVKTFTWDEFEHELLRTPLPPTPAVTYFSGPQFRSWKGFLDHWQGSTRILDHIRSVVGVAA